MRETFTQLLNTAKKYLPKAFIAALIGVELLIFPTLYAKLTTENVRYKMDSGREVPRRGVAIVFGAGVYKDGTPTPYLKSRLETAADLYKSKKVRKILVSGDNSAKHYDEPTAMKNYLHKLGVVGVGEIVVVDYAGFSSYDTCYRAKHIFNVRDAIVVTQGYHLPRAVMTCEAVGIDTVGVAAKSTGRDFTIPYILREYVSTAKASVQTLIKPKPKVLGQPKPIYY